MAPFRDGAGARGGGREGGGGRGRADGRAGRGGSRGAASDAEPSQVDGLVDGDRVADVFRRVADELRAVAVDDLGVAGLRRVGDVLGEGDIVDVRPL